MALKLLLACGILSPLLFVAMNVFVPRLFDGYSLASQTVSELSAIGAPTRPLWVWLGTVYCLLFAASDGASGNQPAGTGPCASQER
jgi:hypothetical protein